MVLCAMGGQILHAGCLKKFTAAMTFDSFSEPAARWRSSLGELFAGWRVELQKLWEQLASRYARNREAVAISAPGDGEAVSSFATRLAGALDLPDAPREISLSFPESALLRARVALPKTSRRYLVQALRYELTRLSPLDPQEVYFDFVANPEAGAKHQRVELRIAKRAEIDAAVRLCHDAALGVASIGFEGDARPADWRLFPVDRLAFARTLWRQWNIAILAGISLVLGFALLVAAYVRHVEMGQELETQLATAQERAAIVERLEEKARIAEAEDRFLESQKRTPMFAAVLAELSRTLPDGTWITQLAMDGGKLQLQGNSQAASNLIGLMDKSKVFANAQFTAPLTQDARSNVEHFDLSVDVRQRP
jgi:general secretion pathway protein L